MKKPWARERMILKCRGITLAPLGSTEDFCMRRVISLERRERKTFVELVAQGLAAGISADSEVFRKLKSILTSCVGAIYGEEEQEDTTDETMLAEFNRVKSMKWTLHRGRSLDDPYKLEIGEGDGQRI